MKHMTANSTPTATQIPQSAKRQIFDLQIEQHTHDEAYHREIARLSLHQRLNHMALHFAKYAGKVASAQNSEIPTIYTDTFIIGLSSANILNAELWDHLESGGDAHESLFEFGLSLMLRRSNSYASPEGLLKETVIAAGRVAAACEKIDHLEDIPFRAEIKAGVARLSEIAIAVLASYGIDPARAVRERLAAVKTRLKLHGHV